MKQVGGTYVDVDSLKSRITCFRFENDVLRRQANCFSSTELNGVVRVGHGGRSKFSISLLIIIQSDGLYATSIVRCRVTEMLFGS